MSKLSTKQLRFVEEYLIDSNASAAAVRAGYSKKTARSQGQRLLTNDYISAELKNRRAITSKKKSIEFEEKIEQQPIQDLALSQLGDGLLKIIERVPSLVDRSESHKRHVVEVSQRLQDGQTDVLCLNGCGSRGAQSFFNLLSQKR